MVDPAEVARVAEAFGVFGGTALALTHLPDGRLSEDVDLMALGDRGDVAAALDAALPSALLRSHGRLTWDRPLTGGRDTEPSVLRTADGLTVRIQLLAATEYPRWPHERRRIHRRYDDAPVVEMLVPTLEAFAAMKLVAWADRAAPRDLYDSGCSAQQPRRWRRRECCSPGTDRRASRRRSGCFVPRRAPTSGVHGRGVRALAMSVS